MRIRPCLRVFIVTAIFMAWAGAAFAGGNDSPSGIAIDNVENVYLTGKTTEPAGFDFVTLKYNAAGQFQWRALYNGPGNGNDTANAVAVDNAGNTYVTGASAGVGSALDYATIKYNANGVRQWVVRYNGPGNGNDIANAIAVDAAGNVYVTGSSFGAATGSDYATIKYNASGVVQWIARYNGPGNGDDIARALTLDAAGNVYVSGSSLNAIGTLDFLTIKYSPTGMQVWTQRWRGYGNGQTVPSAIAIDPATNVIVTGSSLSSGSGLNYMTVKLTANGALVWWNAYNGPGNGDDCAKALGVDGMGNIFITGSSRGVISGLDYATVKYNPNGTQAWVRRYNGPGNGDDSGAALSVDAAGNSYVTGMSIGVSSSGDYATIKYNPSGMPLWIVRYNGPGNGDDSATGVAVNGMSGNVYVTGASLGIGTANDIATIKYNGSGAAQWVNRYDGP